MQSSRALLIILLLRREPSDQSVRADIQQLAAGGGPESCLGRQSRQRLPPISCAQRLDDISADELVVAQADKVMDGACKGGVVLNGRGMQIFLEVQHIAAGILQGRSVRK